MEESGAVSGEKCGLCGTAMNLGAVVCSGCNAKRRVIAKGASGNLGGLCGMIGVLLLILCLFPLLFGNFVWALVQIGAGVGMFAIGKQLREAASKEVTYVQD